MEDSAAAPANRFSLKGRPGVIALEARGFHHPGSGRRGRLVYTPYAELTHLASLAGALWLGTRRTVYVISRSSFVDERDPENLVRALLQRIAEAPGGTAQLARMTQVEETSRLPGEALATRVLMVLCAAVYALKLLGGEAVLAVGQFHPALFAAGEWWRAITANLLHGFALHMILNAVAVLALGSLVERALGSARTLVVMCVSGLASMLASGALSQVPVVGVSGVASGLFGALIWLEFRFAAALPAWWRVPRRSLIWVFVLMALISLLPFVAGAAHLGGFLAGGGAAALLSGRTRLRSRPSPLPVRVLATGGVGLCAAALLTAGLELARHDDYLAHHWRRLSELPDLAPEELNQLAWQIATAEQMPRDLLERARDLAERAVAETDGEVPEILDTLAEVHFRLGDAEQALYWIDLAIRQDPGRSYYHRQRQRFAGEREGGPRDPFWPDFLLELVPDRSRDEEGRGDPGREPELEEGIRV